MKKLEKIQEGFDNSFEENVKDYSDVFINNDDEELTSLDDAHLRIAFLSLYNEVGKKLRDIEKVAIEQYECKYKNDEDWFKKNNITWEQYRGEYVMAKVFFPKIMEK